MWIGRSASAGSRAIHSVSPSRSNDSMMAHRAPCFHRTASAMRLLADPEQTVAIDRLDLDHVDAGLALHGHADHVAGAATPELLVELLLRGDGHAVDADDTVAATEAGVARGPERRETVDDDGTVARHGVEPEPGARRTAHHAPGGEELVLHGDEAFDGNGDVDVRRVAEPQRGDADDAASRVDDRAAAPRVDGRSDDEGAVEHVLPVAGEATDPLHATRGPAQIVVLVDAD